LSRRKAPFRMDRPNSIGIKPNVLIMKILSRLILSILWVGGVLAQNPTTVSGELQGTINWKGTILVKGDVIVAKNSELNIAAGTRVLFANTDQLKEGSDKTRCELNIRGTLIAHGQSNSKIVFTSAVESPRMGDWYGIELLYSEANNILEYCQIEYAHNGITVKNSQGLISHTEFRYNFNAGIVTEVKSNPLIRQCIISENGYAGVVCDLGATPILSNNLITQNPIGIILFSNSKPNLGSMNNDADYNQGENRIINNEQYEIYNHSNQTILAQNNYWGKESATQIDKILYDYNDNSKYGKIDYEPIYHERNTRPPIEQFAALTQNTVRTRSGNTPPAQTARIRSGEANRNNAPANTRHTQTERAATVPIQSQSVNSTAASSQNTTPANSVTDTILLTSAAEVQPLNTTNKEISEPEAPAPVVDYSQVFLEVFIDGGKKEYVKRPKLEITNILRNFASKGEIRVKVNVSPSGDIESTSILKGMNEILDKAVLETVNQYKYKPGRVKGQPVRFTTTELFRFE
jgi:TonB family protein